MKFVGRVIDISRSKCRGPDHQQGLVIGWNKNVHVGPLLKSGGRAAGGLRSGRMV